MHHADQLILSHILPQGAPHPIPDPGKGGSFPLLAAVEEEEADGGREGGGEGAGERGH